MLLGKKVEYISQYDKSLLFRVARSLNRDQLTIKIPMYGEDIWNCYEVSWLDMGNKPIVKIAIISYDANSEFIVESKSLKLYFNSLNNSNYHSVEEVKLLVQKDLSDLLMTNVKIDFYDLDSKLFDIYHISDYRNIDHLDIKCYHYDNVDPNLLEIDSNIVSEKIYTNLLKSNCLVTGQPDWASLFIEYQGPKIIHESLLKYIISFRNHQEFHEHCVERIFTDLSSLAKYETLTIFARFTRRGGIDINPYRSNIKIVPNNLRLIRQ